MKYIILQTEICDVFIQKQREKADRSYIKYEFLVVFKKSIV